MLFFRLGVWGLGNRDLEIKKYISCISLIFQGPDAGANGIRDWNFNRIINSEVVFEI